MGSHVTNLTNHSTFTSQLGSVHILRHLPRGGGGFQKMTLDDGGEGGGGLWSDDVIQNRSISGFFIS